MGAVAVIAKPGVLRYVVSAICRESPDIAGVIVAKAITLQPEDGVILLKAALCAAPRQVEQIVYSACRASPAADGDLMLLAYSELPFASSQIRAGFVRARPDLKPYFEEAEIEAGTGNLAVIIVRMGQLLAADKKTWAG
jgi:hypothetical protein